MFSKYQFLFVLLMLVVLAEVGLCEPNCTTIKCAPPKKCGVTKCDGTCTEFFNPPRECNTYFEGCRCEPGFYPDPASNDCLSCKETCDKCTKIGLKCDDVKLCDGTTAFGCVCPNRTEPAETAPLEDISCYNPCDECGGTCPRGQDCVESICPATCYEVTHPEICERADLPRKRCQCPRGQVSNGNECVDEDVCHETCKSCNGLECGNVDMCDGTSIFTCICEEGQQTPEGVDCKFKDQCDLCGICPPGQKCVPTNCNSTCEEIRNPELCLRDLSKYRCECPPGTHYNANSNECVVEDKCYEGTCEICEKCRRQHMDCGEVDQCNGKFVFGCICGEYKTDECYTRKTCNTCPHTRCTDVSYCDLIQCDGTCKDYLLLMNSTVGCTKERYGCRCPPGLYFEPALNKCVTSDVCEQCSGVKCDVGLICGPIPCDEPCSTSCPEKPPNSGVQCQCQVGQYFNDGQCTKCPSPNPI